MTKLGKERTATRKRNCLNCTRYRKCKDPNKAHDYRCSRFDRVQTVDLFVDRAKERAELEAPKAPKKIKVSETRSRLKKVQRDEEPTKVKTVNSEFERVLSELEDSNSVVIRDIRVDDRDLPLAPNFYTWCTSQNFLNLTPFPKQIEIGLHLYADWCPKCSDKEFVNDVPVDARTEDILDHVVMFEFGICPKCKYNRVEAIEDGELNDYTQLAGLAGQRGGKSVFLSMSGTYSMHWYLKIQDPNRYFGLLRNTILHGTYVALTYNQAKDALWDPTYELLTDTPWFNDYHQLLNDTGNRLGEELYKLKDSFVLYRHRGLTFYPSGPNKRTLRGRTRFAGGIDEIGWFDNQNSGLVKTNAEEVYKAMDRSFQTLRSAARTLRRQGVIHLPNPMFGNISSPASSMDMIVKLEKRSRTSKNIYGFHYSTWEMNPNISKDDLSEEFENDSAGAWRDFGARPPMSGASFVSKIKHFRSVINSGIHNAVIMSPKHFTSESGKLMLSARLKWVWKDINVPKLMTIDAGSSDNSFAIAVGHVNMDDVPVIDIMGEIMPRPDRPVSFSAVYDDVLLPIVTEMNVHMVVSDRWQNLKILQDLESDTGIVPDQYSLKYADFIRWREALYEGQFEMPRPEMSPKDIKDKGVEEYPKIFEGKPVSHYVFQALTVQDVQGKTVEKGDNTTDDIFRSVALLYTYLTDPETGAIFRGVTRRRGSGSAYGVAAMARPGGMNSVTNLEARAAVATPGNIGTPVTQVQGGATGAIGARGSIVSR